MPWRNAERRVQIESHTGGKAGYHLPLTLLDGQAHEALAACGCGLIVLLQRRHLEAHAVQAPMSSLTVWLI